jgi:8-oxo-dGTP pyrophosphatase MutT (NUDIX family)
MPKEVSAGAVIFRRGKGEFKFLLLHYSSGSRTRNAYWDFPKGHIETGENEIETVKREVEEETGLKDITIIDGFREYIKYFFRSTYDLPESEKKKAPWIFKTVFFYLAETKTEEIKISSEHQGYKWLNYEGAIKQLTFKNAKDIIGKANDFILKHKV